MEIIRLVAIFFFKYFLILFSEINAYIPPINKRNMENIGKKIVGSVNSKVNPQTEINFKALYPTKMPKRRKIAPKILEVFM